MDFTISIVDFAERVFNDLSKKRQADQFEVYCSSNRIRSLRIVNNEILESRLVNDSGTGVRVIKDGFTGYASTTKLTLEGGREAYESAARVASSRMGEKESIGLAKPDKENKGIKTSGSAFSDDRLRDLPDEELAEYGNRLIDSGLSYDDRVEECSGSITLLGYEFAVLNSNGVRSCDRGDYVYATLTSVANDGEQHAQGFDTLVTRSYSKFLDNIDDVGKRASKMSTRSLGSKQPPSGKCDIIYTPSCMSLTVLNLSRMASAQRVHDGLSMFTDSLGKQVASDVVNIVEDGRFEDGMESGLVDDEGLPTKRTVIIENGILKSFFHDSYTASKFNVQSTGNGFRVITQVGGSPLQGKRYDFPPVCSSVNFVIMPGDISEEELVQNTKHGILLGWTRYERLLNSRTSAFTSNARSGNFMIEDGEIKYPVHGFRIHDSYMNLLNSIDCIANNLEQKGHWGVASIAPSFRTRNIQIISM
jgi:PmbA protein